MNRTDPKIARFSRIALFFVLILFGSATSSHAVESLVALGKVDDDGTLLSGHMTIDGTIEIEKSFEGEYRIRLISDDDSELFESCSISLTPVFTGATDVSVIGGMSSRGFGEGIFDIFTRDMESSVEESFYEPVDNAFYFVIRRLPDYEYTVDTRSPFLIALGSGNTGTELDRALGIDGIEVTGEVFVDGIMAVTLRKEGAFAGDTVDDYIIEASTVSEELSDEVIRSFVTSVTDDVVTILFSTNDVQSADDGDDATIVAQNFTFSVFRIAEGAVNRPPASKLFFSSIGFSPFSSTVVPGFTDRGLVANAGVTESGDKRVLISKVGFFEGKEVEHFLPIVSAYGFGGDSHPVVKGMSLIDEHTLEIIVSVLDLEEAGQGNGLRTFGGFHLTLYDINPSFQPDLLTGKKRSFRSMRGNNTYNTSGAGQTKKIRGSSRKGARAYFAVQNDGQVPDGAFLRARAKKNGYKLKVFRLSGGRANFTAALRRSVLLGGSLYPDQATILEVRVKAKGKSKRRPLKVSLLATSTTDGTPDVASAKIVVK